MKIFNLLQFSLALLLTHAAMAQEKAPKHTCRILFFNAPADAPTKLHLFDGEKSQEVELPKMNFSPVYQLRSGSLSLRLLPAPPTDPEAIPSAAPSVQIPKEVVDFYLLVTSDPANSVAPVRMQVINADTDKLKDGQSLWFNLSKNTVGGKLGTEKLVIQPGKREVIDAPAKGAEDYPVSLAFQIPGDEHLYPLCETSWRHDPHTRSVVFIHSDPSSRTPRVMGFSDFRQPGPEKTP